MAETFDEYKQRILSYLGDQDPINVQRATSSLLDGLLDGVENAILTWSPAVGKWSIGEIVAHLADAELAMGWRLRNMLATPGIRLSWWDEALWAERLNYSIHDVRQSVTLFRSLRENNLILLESVPRRSWDECYGVHDVRGRQSVAEFVWMEAAHDLNHLKQIERILNNQRRS